MGLKILTSRACELADISELDLNLSGKDQDFVDIAKKFLLNLMRVKDIIPLPQCLRTGIGFTSDGGIPVFGAVGYVIIKDNVTLRQSSRLVCSKSKISKRTVPANESLARILQMDAWLRDAKRFFQLRPNSTDCKHFGFTILKGSEIRVGPDLNYEVISKEIWKDFLPKKVRTDVAVRSFTDDAALFAIKTHSTLMFFDKFIRCQIKEIVEYHQDLMVDHHQIWMILSL